MRYPLPPLLKALEFQRSHCWQTKSLTPFVYVEKRALNCPIDQIMSNVAQNIVNFNLPDISVSIFPGHLTLPKLITNVRLVVVVGVDACVAFLVVCKGRSQLRRRSIRATAAPPISHTPDNNIGARAARFCSEIGTTIGVLTAAAGQQATWTLLDNLDLRGNLHLSNLHFCNLHLGNQSDPCRTYSKAAAAWQTLLAGQER